MISFSIFFTYLVVVTSNAYISRSSHSHVFTYCEDLPNLNIMFNVFDQIHPQKISCQSPNLIIQFKCHFFVHIYLLSHLFKLMIVPNAPPSCGPLSPPARLCIPPFSQILRFKVCGVGPLAGIRGRIFLGICRANGLLQLPSWIDRVYVNIFLFILCSIISYLLLFILLIYWIFYSCF